jgi:hypothetical protein
MIFRAIHMTEKWPHMMTEKRPFWLYTATGDIFFSVGKQFFCFTTLIQLPMAHIKITFKKN